MAGPSSKKGKDSSSGSSGHKFQVGDVVLAKIKGFPAWPGVLVGDDQVPEVVLREKPQKKFIIRFFPKADYHFPSVSDLTLLTRQECKAYAEDSHRKDGELKAAYKIGADPDDWIAETDAVVREAEKARQEALLEEEENEDQLADEDEAPKPKKPASKKRAAAPAKPSSSVSAKKQKTEAKDSKSAAPRKSAGGDDDVADDAELDEATKKVKGWRHAIQRAFLPKGRDVSEADVQGQDEVFATVEKADITADQLKATKINKVMRKIVGLETIPTNDVHHFKERAEALLSRWAGLGQGETTEKKPAADGEAAAGASEPKAEGETNGHGNADGDVGDLTEIADTTVAPATNGSD